MKTKFWSIGVLRPERSPAMASSFFEISKMIDIYQWRQTETKRARRALATAAAPRFGRQ